MGRFVNDDDLRQPRGALQVVFPRPAAAPPIATALLLALLGIDLRLQEFASPLVAVGEVAVVAESAVLRSCRGHRRRSPHLAGLGMNTHPAIGYHLLHRSGFRFGFIGFQKGVRAGTTFPSEELGSGSIRNVLGRPRGAGPAEVKALVAPGEVILTGPSSYRTRSVGRLVSSLQVAGDSTAKGLADPRGSGMCCPHSCAKWTTIRVSVGASQGERDAASPSGGC